MNQNTGLKPHRGGMMLAFGIVGFLCCVVFAILAWVMGKGDLKEMEEGRMDPAGEGMTKAGMILGIIACVLNAIGLIVWIGLLAFGMTAAASQGFH